MPEKRNLYLASLTLGVIVIALIFWNYHNSIIVEKNFNDLYTRSFQEVHAIQDMRFGVVRIVSSTSELLLLRSLKKKKGEKGEKDLIAEGREVFQESFRRFKSHYEQGWHDGTQVDIERLEKVSSRLMEVSRDLVTRKEISAAEILEGKEVFESLELKTLKMIDVISSAIMKKNRMRVVTMESTVKTMRFEVMLLGGIVLAAFLGYVFFVIHILRSLRWAWGDLAQSQRLFQAVMDDNADAMTISDAGQVFTRWNKAAERLYGYSEEEMIGKTYQFLIPEGYEEDIDIGQSVHTSGINAIFDTHRRRKDGTIFPVNVSLSGIRDENGNITAVCAIHKDLTERLRHGEELRRQGEELRRAKEAAEAASHTKSEFLANMSHEIRTPMNGVIGMTRFLLGAGLTERQRKYAENAQSSAESLLTIINEILDISKIEAGQMEIEPISFNLRQTVEEVMELLAVQVREKGLELAANYGSGIPERLIGDPGRIRQILNNLVNNAVKFTGKGHVHIDVRMMEKTDDGVLVRISVEDTGIGVEEDQIPHLFDKFTQADASTTRRFGGTGLGLSICKELAELMDGDIGAFSRPGGGSTFWFTLPLPVDMETPSAPSQPAEAAEVSDVDTEAPSAPSPPAEAAGDAGVFSGTDDLAKGARILLAEDNYINELVAREILEVLGCSVDVAANGIEALEMLKALPYDAVFMDCQMPEMDGFEATMAIRRREEESGGHIPIIAMTASVMQGDRDQCLEAGMDDFIAKPVKPEEVKASLVRWMGEKKA